MTEEGKKTATGSVTSLAGRDSGKAMVAFYDVLKKIEETEAKAVIPLLKRIEKNTAGLQKSALPGPANPKSPKAATAAKYNIPKYASMPRAAAAIKEKTSKKPAGRRRARVAESKEAGSRSIIADAEDSVITDPIKVVKPGKKPAPEGKRKRRDAAAETEEILSQGETEPVKRATRARRKPAGVELAESEGNNKRDASGRFIGKSKSQEAREKQREEAEKKSVLQSLKDGFDTVTGGGGRSGGEPGAIEGAAGTAVGGAVYEAAIEMKEALVDATGEDGILGKVAGKFGRRSEDEDEDEETAAEAIAAVEKEDKKRHKELIDAINGGGGETEPGGKSGSALKSVKDKVSGPFRNIGGKVKAGAGMLASGAMAAAKTLLPAAAVATAAAVGVGIGTAIDKGISKVGEKVTGKKGWSIGGQVYDWTHKDDAAASFESGRGKKTLAQRAGTISSGEGDRGGKSYGTYQLASKLGEVERFLNQSGYASQFSGLKVGSKEFDEKWKSTAEQDPEFAKAQKQYTLATKYAPMMKKLADAGMDLSGKGKAVQEMVLSTANQYGANSNVIERALKGRDVAAMSEADIISAVQDFKAQRNKLDFRNSSPKVQAGVAKRIQEEKEFLLAVDRIDKQKKQQAGTQAQVAAAPEPGIKPVETAAGQPATAPITSESRQVSQTAPVATATEPVKPAETAGKKKKTRRQIVLAETAQAEETPIQTAGGEPVIKPAVPERMTAAIPSGNSFALAGKQAAASPAQGSDNTAAAMLKAVESLNATVSKMQGKDKKGAASQQIPTEFDDTMLTLMAYDRI